MEEELRKSAENCVVAVYGDKLPPNVKNGLINMYLAGLMEGYMYTTGLAMSEDKTEEEVMYLLEEFGNVLTNIRDNWVKEEELKKARNEGLSQEDQQS